MRRPEEPQSSPTVDLELWARPGKAISTVQRNLCKNAKMLLLGCVALGWLGRPLESSWPGEVGRRLGDAQSSPTVDRALGEARKANFTLQRNLCKNDVFSCCDLGWLGRPWDSCTP